jgi:hypothetical protein
MSSQFFFFGIVAEKAKRCQAGKGKINRVGREEENSKVAKQQSGITEMWRKWRSEVKQKKSARVCEKWGGNVKSLKEQRNDLEKDKSRNSMKVGSFGDFKRKQEKLETVQGGENHWNLGGFCENFVMICEKWWWICRVVLVKNKEVQWKSVKFIRKQMLEISRHIKEKFA